LETIVPRFFGQQFKLYFQDLSGSYAQVRSVLDSHQKMIDSLHQTNESLLSNKISEIMQILTVISFITLPLIVISSFFNMNIDLNSIAFKIIAGFMLASIVITFVSAKKKKWL